MTDPVARRLAFHIAGYDPMSAETAYHRFTREMGRFRSAWAVEADVGPPRVGEDIADWRVLTTGRDWTVESELRWLRWDDVMARLDRLSVPRRLALGFQAFGDFVGGGVLRSYAKHNWRYALFFVYPVAQVLLYALAGLIVGWLAFALTGWLWLGLLLGAGVFAAILQWARKGMRLDHLLDDWIFAREHIRDPDPVLSARLDRLAEQVVEAARSGEVDEVLLIGHSLGAVLAVEIVDRALSRDPALGEGATAVSLATVGSSVPKLGFHRAAQPLRDALRRVGAARGIVWVDYQAYVDVMNFHKLHPVRGLGAGERGPLVRFVPIRKVLNPEYYRRIRKNLLRVHNQFVSGNDVRSVYDYFMLICGPRTLAASSAAENGAADCVAPDGSLVREPPKPYIARPGLDRMP